MSVLRKSPDPKGASTQHAGRFGTARGAVRHSTRGGSARHAGRLGTACGTEGAGGRGSEVGAGTGAGVGPADLLDEVAHPAVDDAEPELAVGLVVDPEGSGGRD